VEKGRETARRRLRQGLWSALNNALCKKGKSFEMMDLKLALASSRGLAGGAAAGRPELSTAGV
jgi:hypothetical protein